MGSSIAIHCNPSIDWQSRRAPQILNGLLALGLRAHITTNRQRESEHAVILGTTFFRAVESTGHFLLVDRASVGDPEYVQLVWDGHGRRGNHCVPEKHHDRPIEATVHKWETAGRKVVLCGQTEPYSPHYQLLKHWYDRMVPNCTHFRHHPADANPTILPLEQGWCDVGRMVTLNSSVAVESVLNGIPAVSMDEGSMAWDVTSHHANVSLTADRDDWLHWLSWTQWHWDEIAAGEPIRHLFEEFV